MPASTCSRTLYEDWIARRERLEGLPGEGVDYRAVEMRLLDYLLRRYRDSPEAARPARFPLSKNLFVDHRAIVVHHHLGRGQIPEMGSPREASDHVRAVVERMQSPPAEAGNDAPPAFTVPPPADPVEAARARLCDSDPVVRIEAALELGETGDLDDIGLLSDLLSLPATPESKEHPREREALLRAIEWLSGASLEPFDLSDIVPPPRRRVLVTSYVRRPKRRTRRRTDFYFYMSLAVLAAIIFIVGGVMLALAPAE